ncbi:glucose-1-phosphate thymidylyltransferase [Candidatus Saccharibacteria bacterium]|nr:glucose-1-phosphate thymidylyltransferase [Calditrichia bacterium]NIV71656.1 glucose-1-phosphate thymidylyltransferase [Calditrichia bacterium]NIV98281.1 glucose-1-phosphate thymidylyltransferase [Candidatus Saccharibacteria bacterium]
MKALITSGGKGTRLRPITHTQNKHLIPIANKPILHYAIDAVAEAGIKEIGILVNADSDEVPKAIGNGENWGVNITYIPQEAPLGLAHVVKVSQDFIKNDSFIFYLGDNMVVGGVKRFIDKFQSDHSNCHLTLARVKDPSHFGVPELKGSRIVSIEEKPKHPKSEFAVAGIYLYDTSIFEAVNAIKPSARGELEISDAHQYLLEKGKKITYSEITGWWKDTGKPFDLLEANRLILENLPPSLEYTEVDPTSNLAGKVLLEKGAKIINSNVRGPVIIGKNSEIRDSYIGPYTAIYHDTLIQNSEVEFSIIMDHCKITDVGIRIESSIFGSEVEIVRASDKPKTHRFILGAQSRLEVV